MRWWFLRERFSLLERRRRGGLEEGFIKEGLGEVIELVKGNRWIGNGGTGIFQLPVLNHTTGRISREIKRGILAVKWISLTRQAGGHYVRDFDFFVFWALFGGGA
ncbi:unnamed protein product [Dovyalis caffra]|uniref:Uncharacterized protein n=1 Tax=Dovyalis caffra TaxID=77055 RepID=A0AAV1RAB8_9ROSI|nr:unnamed protein product [Dovyalis caffra]